MPRSRPTPSRSQSIGALARLARDVDVVHYHFPWPFMDLAHFMARVNKPTVVTYHSDIVRQKPPAAPVPAAQAPLPAQRRRHRRDLAQLPGLVDRAGALSGQDQRDPVRPGQHHLPAARSRPPGALARAGRPQVLPVRRRAALLQGPAHPARGSGRHRLPGRHRWRRPDRAGAQGASRAPGPEERACSSARSTNPTRLRC